MTEYDILHDLGSQRFETTVEGVRCVAEYRLYGNVLDIVHTYVPSRVEGRGIAGALVRAAYDYARRSGLRLEGSCSYAAAWLQRHPDYRAG